MSGYIYPPNECIPHLFNSQNTFINICEVKIRLKVMFCFKPLWNRCTIEEYIIGQILKYVSSLEENVSRAIGQNSLTP